MKNGITEMNISKETTVKRNPELLHSHIDGEVVMLSMDTGKYYKIDDIGSLIWERIEEPRSIESICKDLVEEYEVDAEQCLNDVMKFVVKLQEDKLITIS